MRDAEAGELPLHHEDSGAGRPLVLIHGWSLSSAAFALESARLAAGHRVIALDLPGHGRTPPGPFTLGALASRVAALVSGLELDGAVLAGWSLGAQVALAALPLVRERIAGVALVCGTPRFTSGPGWEHGLPARELEVLARRVRRDPARAVGAFFDGMFVPGELDEPGRRRAAALRAGIPVPAPECALAGLDLLAREDLRPALAGADVPVLLLHGERDPVCPAGASGAMADALPRARLQLLPGAGHAPFLARPGALAGPLAGFAGALA